MPGFAPLFLLLGIFGLGLAWLGLKWLLADRRLQLRLQSADGKISEPKTSEWRLPSFIVIGAKDREEIEHKLRLAGFLSSRAVEVFAIARLAITSVAIIGTGLVSLAVGGSFFAYPLYMVIVGGLPYIGAKLALEIFAAGRARRVTAEFPFLLDLMFMMLQSGISLDQCFRTLANDRGTAVPILTTEFALLVADLDRGMSYEMALDRWSSRIAIKGSRELAALFRQGLFQGIELTPALREFAAELTQRRLAAAKEAMGNITVRMVVLMILFFMPALFIVLGGPPVVSVLDTLAQTAGR